MHPQHFIFAKKKKRERKKEKETTVSNTAPLCALNGGIRGLKTDDNIICHF